MRALQLHFFLTYAILGSVSTLWSVYLERYRGLTQSQVGLALSMLGLANAISPWMMTLLADTRFETRHILATSCAAMGLIFGLLCLPAPSWLTVGLMMAYGLALVSTLPLQDGFYFNWAEREAAAGRPKPPYVAIRLWGTVGFLVPAMLVYLLLHYSPWFKDDLRVALWLGMACAVLGVWSSLRILPRVPKPVAQPGKLPTIQAFQALLRPQALVYVCSLALASGSVVAYHYFFPQYLTKQLGCRPETVPLIVNIGVIGEIIYSVYLPRLEIRWGMKPILVAGLVAMVLRLVLLALFPSVTMAALVQILHGMEIYSFFLIGPVLLNSLAEDRFRNSIQGAFSMTLGLCRFFGSNLTGRALETHSYRDVFLMAACCGAVSTLVIALFFKPWQASVPRSG